MITNVKKLKYCLILNVIVLFIIILLSFIFRVGGSYWNFGPNKVLVIISVHIDTWSKYFILLTIITLINISKVIIEEIGMPILNFNIYNPDKKHITEFTKLELHVYGNTMYAISNIRRVLLLILNISQIDIAIYNIFVCEVTSIFTIRMLLNEKHFVRDIYNDAENQQEDMQILRT